MLMPIFTSAIVGTGNRSIDAKSIVLKRIFFILSPHMMDLEWFAPIARSCFIDYFCFFIIFFAGFFSPIIMGIIFFIFLNCSSVKIVRISFMAFTISR